ncbi:PASTA domain-containing protein [Elusimicrobiota bacterium]
MIKYEKIKPLIKAGVIAALILFAGSVLSIWMVNILMKEVIHTRKEVVVPDIVGMTINEALEVLTEKNLSLQKVADKYDTDIPAGSIISQSPPPGLTVREGKAVESVISSGGKVVFIPEIEGKSLRQAELLLRQAGLTVGEQTRTYSSTVKINFIVSQDPASGEVVEKNSYVNIVVSRGPAEEEKIKKMPNLLGMNIKVVEKILEEMELELVKVTQTVNDDLKEGTVISQTPNQGMIVDKNTKVELELTIHARSTKEVRDETIYYEVIQTGRKRDVKIIIIDGIGERIVLEEEVEGGSKIELPVKVLGEAKVQIFVDDILNKEEELKFIVDEEDEEDSKDKKKER